MSETVRFTVSINSELLGSFDEAIREKKYENRSKAIRDLIRDFIIERKWEKKEGEVIAALTFLYSHARGVNEKLMKIQHDRCSNIISTMHIHLDEYNCMELIAIKGDPQEVTEVSDKLISCKGVKHGKLVMTSMRKRPV